VIESSQSILGGTDPLSLRSPHFHFRRGGQPPPSPRQRGLHNNDRRSPPPAPCRTWSHVSQGSACAAGAVGHGVPTDPAGHTKAGGSSRIRPLAPSHPCPRGARGSLPPRRPPVRAEGRAWTAAAADASAAVAKRNPQTRRLSM
jgi:hypothetical protein